MKDLMSIVDLIFGLLLATGMAVVFVVGLIAVIELAGCI